MCLAGLWLWNKLAAGPAGTPAGSLPPAYMQALQEATNLVVVQPCDNWCAEQLGICSCGGCSCLAWHHRNCGGGQQQVFRHCSRTDALCVACCRVAVQAKQALIKCMQPAAACRAACCVPGCTATLRLIPTAMSAGTPSTRPTPTLLEPALCSCTPPSRVAAWHQVRKRSGSSQRACLSWQPTMAATAIVPASCWCLTLRC